MAKNEAKIQFTADCEQFNESIKKADSTMKELRSELKLNEAQMDANGKSIDKLENKHEILQKQLDAASDKTKALAEKLEAAKRNFGENSLEVDKWSTQLNNAKTAQSKLEKAVKDCEAEIEEFNEEAEKSNKSTKEASEGFTVFKGVVADLASNAIQQAIGAMSEFVGYIADLPEATRELRQTMATLDTSFETMGHSGEQAKNTFKELYSVVGDEGKASEASSMIAKMADNQEELTNWTRIATGVFGTYQDTLPIEALTEAALETSNCGTVTGALADALNWSKDAATMFSKYMSEDVVTAEDAFNVALSECTTEQERQSLITETLTALYGGAADKYRETAGAQLEAKEATAEHMLAESELAATIEPMTTAWQEMKTEMLVGLAPAIQTITDLMLGALEWAKEHPTAMKAIAAAVGVLAVGFGGLATALGIYTAAQWAMNSAVLANPITWVVAGIVVAIAGLVAAGVALYQNWDTVKAKCTEIWTKISTTFSNIKKDITDKINGAKKAVGDAIDKIKGFFDFEWSLPKLKLPHFSISGEFNLKPPSVPSIGIDWYKDGGIFTKPTIFNTPFGLKGVGEAGAEAVLPINRLEGYISGAIEKAQNVVNLNSLASAIEDLANRPVVMNINGRQFATATASDSDSVYGLRTSFKSRGLIVE